MCFLDEHSEDVKRFYAGTSADSYEFLGAHPVENGTHFAVYKLTAAGTVQIKAVTEGVRLYVTHINMVGKRGVFGKFLDHCISPFLIVFSSVGFIIQHKADIVNSNIPFQCTEKGATAAVVAPFDF